MLPKSENNFIWIVIVLLIIVAWKIIISSSYETKGKKGEDRIKAKLSKIKDGILLNDLLLKTKWGYSQIDHVLLTTQGIFVIETKNYSGSIYGNDNQKYWTHYYRNGRTGEPLYNPIWQNHTHAKVIKQYLINHGITQKCIIPITVFINDSISLNITTNNLVIFDNDLIETINLYKEKLLTTEMVEHAAQILTENNITDISSRKEHIQNCKKARHST